MTLAPAAVLVGLFVALWLVSLVARDASLVDLLWGPAFAAVAWTSVAAFGPSPRGLLSAGLATAWAARLAIHLARRNLGRGEDYRYREMRARHGARFPLVSLGTVFLLQAALAWVVSLPLQVAARPAPIDALAAAGAIVAAAGIAIEAFADAQLARFRRDPASRGQVMDRGLWRWSRHPNYFGDAVVWWGFGLMGLSAPWSLFGPLVMTVLLVRVSGVALLEKTISHRRPGYAEYVARTSAFVPWPRRRS
jgi:steroid 5-alpha reductase family enzyme